jgi:hypothetical protein
VEFDAAPDPSAAEREALRLALAALLQQQDDPLESRWWRTGLAENLADEPAGPTDEP